MQSLFTRLLLVLNGAKKHVLDTLIIIRWRRAGRGQSGRTGSSAGGVGVNSEYETLGGVAEQKMADKKRGFNGK